MMQVGFLAAVCCVATCVVSLAAQAEAVKVTPDQAKQWIRYTVPLPKQIEITEKVVVSKGDYTIRLPEQSDQVTTQMIKELRELLGDETGRSGRVAFKLTLEIGGPDAEPLKSLRNSEQAYTIFAPGGSSNELKLVALTSDGLYYAAKTLQQLVAAHATSDKLEIPIVKITDWPDMEKRGLWGNDNWLHLRWMADRKMNIAEQISLCGVDDNGKIVAKLQAQREPMVTEGPLYAVEPAPVVLHLEQVGQGNVFKFFPQYQGKSEHKGALCYSQPGVTEMISEWMVQLASLPNVNAIDAWMAENMQGQTGCQCEGCKDTDRSVMESRVIVKAWRKAQERLGRKLGLYMLTSEATEESNKLFFPELPPEVRIWYYHSLLTYNSTRVPMLKFPIKYMADDLKTGRWIGVCPNLCASVGFPEPFTGADFIHARMNEFVDTGLQGLLGYASPRVHYYKFNVEAAAEWGWNAKGRSPREFTLSWAMRQGLKDPEKFAEWSDTLGPVSWDVYGSAWPAGESQHDVPGKVTVRLKKGTLDDLGYILWDSYSTPWGDIKTPQQLDHDVAMAAKGLKLAQEMGIPEFMQESLVVDGLIRALKAVHELRGIIKPTGIAVEDRDAARRNFLAYIESLAQAKQAIAKWENCVARRGEDIRFTKRPVESIANMIDEMRQLAADYGIDLPKG